MTEYLDDLKRRCTLRKWACNNFTCYLLESHLTASKVAYLMGTKKSSVYHWLYMENLPGAVNFIFLTARKMAAMGKDLFAYV